MFNEYLHRCNDISELATVHGGGSLYEEPYVGTYNNDVFYNKEKVFSFFGLEISPGPLYYDGTNYEIKNYWNYDSYKKVYGENAGSYYFSYTEMINLFYSNHEHPNMYDSNPKQYLLNPLGNNWRLFTWDEYSLIFDTYYDGKNKRNGSTVNGISGIKAVKIQLLNVKYCDSYTPAGNLLFPDDAIITGKDLLTNQINILTNSELNEYLNQGCVFIPYSEYYGEIIYRNTSTEYIDWCYDISSPSLAFTSDGVDDNNQLLCGPPEEKYDSCYFKVYLVREI